MNSPTVQPPPRRPFLQRLDEALLRRGLLLSGAMAGFLLPVLTLFLLLSWFASQIQPPVLHMADYTTICQSGKSTTGYIDTVSEESNYDDDYWRSVTFSYSHDGHDYHGKAYVGYQQSVAVGDEVQICYAGNRAVLRDLPPPSFLNGQDFWNSYLLTMFSFSVLLSPVGLMILIALCPFIGLFLYQLVQTGRDVWGKRRAT